MAVRINEEQRKKEVATLLSVIIQNTDIVPFRWHKSKYMCFYCQEIFVESEKLKQHTSSKHKRIKIRDVLVRTLYKCGRIKLDVSDLYCRPCNTQFSSFDLYFKHLSKTHGLTFDAETAKSFDCFQLADNGMFCLQCGQHFGFFGPLLVHTYKDHIDHILCEICGLGFAGKLNVQHHVKHMHEIKSCKDCNETFQSQYALKNHVENVHRIDKLKCPMCPEILANSYLKKRHLALIHDCKSAQSVCELCSKIFTRNSRYVKHKLRVHFKEKNFTCEICGHKAFDLESLKCHMVRHDDAKPFKCEVCDKKFRRKRNLVMHLRTHKIDDMEVETLETDSS